MWVAQAGAGAPLDKLYKVTGYDTAGAATSQALYSLLLPLNRPNP